MNIQDGEKLHSYGLTRKVVRAETLPAPKHSYWWGAEIIVQYKSSLIYRNP